MSFIPGMRPVPFVAAGAALPDPTLTFRGEFNDPVDRDTYTFNFAIGTADANRWVIVAERTAATVTGVTVGGEAATMLVTAVDFDASIWIANVPAGTSADVVISAAGSTRCSGGVWTVDNLHSSTPVDTANSNSSSGASLDVDTVDGGFVVAFVWANSDPTIGFSAGVTEDFDIAIESSQGAAGGSASGLTAATPRTVTTTVAGATAGSQVCVSMK